MGESQGKKKAEEGRFMKPWPKPSLLKPGVPEGLKAAQRCCAACLRPGEFILRHVHAANPREKERMRKPSTLPFEICPRCGDKFKMLVEVGMKEKS